MSRIERFEIFSRLHDGGTLLRLPNAWDAGSAKIVVHAGARAVATTSSGVANALGYADGNNLPRALAIELIGRVAAAVPVPVTADIEEGYGDTPDEAAATAADVIGIGAVGINIEDGLKPPELLAAKIRAIRARLGSEPLYINARIDTWLKRLPDPLNEALRRAALYLEAGASGIFVPAIVRADDIRKVCETVKAPINVMLWPDVPGPDELQRLGVARLSAGGRISAAAAGATWRAATAFLAGDYAVAGENGLPREVSAQLFA